MSVKSIPIEHDEVFNTLLQDELSFFRTYKNLERVVGITMVGICGITAHMLVLLQVRFYDAVDFVSKVFFPILFIYLPILAYVKTFKNWLLVFPLIVFLLINIAAFL